MLLFNAWSYMSKRLDLLSWYIHVHVYCYNYYSVKLKKAILQLVVITGFIIPFSLTQEATRCTLLMPQVFIQVCIKVLLALIDLLKWDENLSLFNLTEEPLWPHYFHYGIANGLNWEKLSLPHDPNHCTPPMTAACLNRYRLADIPC